MDKLKKWMIFIVIVCIILLIMIILLILNLNTNNNVNQLEADAPSSQEEEEYEDILNQSITVLKSEEDFFTLEKQIQNYFLYLRVANQKAIYNILDNNYITENQIKEENAADIVKSKYNNINGEFELKQVYVRDSIAKPIYYSFGTLKEGQSKRECYFIVYWDQQNITFALKPISKQQYNVYITEEKIEQNTKNIEAKQYNKLSKILLSEEDKATKYFNSYIQNALYDVQTSYTTLDNEYKEKRFTTIEQYNEYLNNKKAELVTMDTQNIKQFEDFSSQEEYSKYLNTLKFESIEKFQIKNQTDYKQCICIDTYENYYIFKITGAMQYTVILDTYTIDLPEFIAKYQAATEEEKVLMNIQKFFQAIDAGDYNYAYNKLDETYKANNFSTLEEFTNYAKTTFYKSNSLSSKKAEKQNDIYLYEITIKDKQNQSQQSITKTFVMQLKEGTDFVMSFSH